MSRPNDLGRCKLGAAAVIGVVVAGLALAGCTSSGPAASPSTPAPSTRTTVVGTRTASPAPSFTPAPATTVAPASGEKAPKGEVAKRCPYIRTGLQQDPTNKPNMADLEGDRIALTTVLPDRRPVGCRFYFWTPPFNATADILPTTFSSAFAAHNAMVLTAQQGTSVNGVPHFVPGVDGVSYRTKFYGPDHGHDYAFVFAKGKVMVIIHTFQDNSPRNAQNIAEAIVGKF